MLTGYDSKWLNTLYMDKFYRWSNIEMIIQAFSRTNRVFTEDKPHGIIRYYRRPYTMKNIIEYAFAQYSGNKPYGIFVLKLKENLEAMNCKYKEIKQLFQLAGSDDFSKLPEDIAERQKFSKLFGELNKYLESAKIQGFVWEQLTYVFDLADGRKESYTLDFDKTIFDILLQRYKELRKGKQSESDDIPYDIDPYLMSLSTEKINSDYMNSKFTKYVKMLERQEDEGIIEDALNELHRSFASLSVEQQKFANILLRDIQNHDIILDDNKSVMDYIIEYQTRAKSDQISIFSYRLGIYEKGLRDLMSKHVTKDDINAFGQYDKLIQSVNIDLAKKYFDAIEGRDLRKREVRAKLDNLLRRFVLENGFDL
ncbi:Type I restriction-modification system, restriction subunit R [Lachnospiraceae bacterium TWA4]|nr:Type I restriction-modification system, restriction subunit R [Lachnospiraceae bacterium TWA4]